MTRRLVAVIVTAVALGLAGCDSGPQGPGSITGFATGPDVGGVVLEVRGSGIRSFSARGSTRLYSAAVQDRRATHRVVLISPEPGELAFDMEVDDLGMEGPTVRVVSAADGQNRAIVAANVSVRLER